MSSPKDEKDAKQHKEKTTKSIPLDIDYVAINTGYVGRTVCHFLYEGAQFKLEQEEYSYNKDTGRDPTKDRILSAWINKEEKHEPSEIEETRELEKTSEPSDEEKLKEMEARGYESRYHSREYDYETFGGGPDYMIYDDELEDEVRKPHIPLYIADTLHGEGLYSRVGADPAEIALVLKCLSEIRGPSYCGKESTQRSHVCNNSGIAVFECKDIARAFKIAQNMASLNYCACFSPNNPMETELLEDIPTGRKILHLHYDCESG